MEKSLEFELFSGGKILIDLKRCKGCSSKACIKNCRSSKTRPVLVIKDGLPALSFDYEQLKNGACTECLGCELDCWLYGNKAVSIELPLK
jgi:hypothetical protein